MRAVSRQIRHLWGCYPLGGAEDTIELSSDDYPQSFRYSSIKESLEEQIQKMKSQLAAEIEQFSKNRIEETIQFLERSDLQMDQLKQMIILKDREYLELYGQLMYEGLNKVIQRIRVLSLMPEQASNLELREMVLQLKQQIVEQQKAALDEDEPSIEQQKNERQFTSNIEIIREDGDDIAGRLKHLIHKKNQSKVRGEPMTSAERIEKGEGVSQRLLKIQRELQIKNRQFKQLQTKFRLAQTQLKQSNTIVSQLKDEMSSILKRDSQLQSIEKPRPNNYFQRKRRQETGEKLPSSSETLDYTSSQRSTEERIGHPNTPIKSPPSPIYDKRK